MPHDSYISPFSTRYASKEMQFVFSEDNKFRTWRRLWIALARAEQKQGLEITDEQIAELEAHKDDINYEDAQRRERECRHDVMSHVYAYGLQCPKAAGIIHLGATSCYVGDNTDVILMREGLQIVRRKLLNVMALLLATLAGFGSIIGIFIRFIRGYNRISPYIIFFALLTMGLTAEKRMTQRTGKSRAAFAAVLAVLLVFGFWEQQGLYNPKYESVQKTWQQDEDFVAEVESAAGEGAMIFQLPYMKNFENGPQNKMWDYTLLRGPLHSKTLKFSYGAGYGTENDNWYKATSELEPEAMVAELRAQGMAGIYLDLDGYTEEEQQPTLQALINAAGCDESDVIISEGGTLCYIPLGKG